MLLNFKQGIVSADKDIFGNPNFIIVNGANLTITTSVPATFALSHGTTNYLHSENVQINAWPLPASTVWLYIDIDQVSAARTFGTSLVEPTYGTTQPTAVDDLHWFNTSTNIMYVYSAALNRWQARIRVFMGKFDNNTILFYPFGSQVGIQSIIPIYSAGRIMYDITGSAIQRPDGKFLTTEDELRINGTVSQGVRLESNTTTAKSNENISAFSVVAYTDFGKVSLADYEDTGITVLAMATADALTNDIIPIILQGIVTNITWNWTTSGAPLWVDTNGSLTLTDPHSVNNSRKAQVPIARVLTQTSIIFEQGLGGKGEQGDSGSAVSVPPASVSVPGISRLSVAAASPSDPIVVGNNDPRLTDSRPPAIHTHQAIDVTVSPFGTITATNVQTTLQQINTDKLAIAGGTMTGALILNADPTTNLQAATKQYVDGLVSGLGWIDPICLVNMISDSLVTPPVSPTFSDAYIVATGGTSSWTGLDGHVVIWDGSVWLDRGLLSAFVQTRRFGVSMESGTVASGTFVGHNNHIAIWNPTLMTWSFYVPAINDAVWVCSELSLHSYHQYAFDGTSWVEFGGTQAVTPGTNLVLVGNSLNVVDYSAGGTINAATLQGQTPSQIVSTKVNKAGDTMTGALVLNADPTTNLQAATKQYVDSNIGGGGGAKVKPIQTFNLISDTETTPPVAPNYLETYIVGTGATGDWAGLDGNLVVWDSIALIWQDKGVFNTGFNVGCDFGIAMVPYSIPPTGTFAGKAGQIGTWDGTLQTWTFYTPVEGDVAISANDLGFSMFDQPLPTFAYDGIMWVQSGADAVYADNTTISYAGGEIGVIPWSNGGTVDAAFLEGHPAADFVLSPLALSCVDIPHIHYLNHYIPFFISGAGIASGVVGMYIFPEGMTSNLFSMVSKCRVPATATSVYSLQVNNVEVATLTFNPGWTFCNPSVGAIVFNFEDTLSIVAPAILDSTLSDIAINITAERFTGGCLWDAPI